MMLRLNTLNWRAFTCALVVLGSSAARAQTAQPTPPLTEQDRKLDCPGLRAALADATVQVKRAQAAVRKEAAAPPTSLAQMFQSAPPTAAAAQVKTLRARSEALAALTGTKGCHRIDAAPKWRLGGAIKPEKALADRCEVRGELSLQDCVEDVAKWRCRSDNAKGRAYLVCLDQTAERVVTASGYDFTMLAHYDPGCNDPSYAPASCSVFTSNRNGPDTKSCKRVSESTIEVCVQAKGGTPAITAADGKAAVGKTATTGSVKAATTVCHPVACKLGTSCDRLCGPPD